MSEKKDLRQEAERQLNQVFERIEKINHENISTLKYKLDLLEQATRIANSLK